MDGEEKELTADEYADVDKEVLCWETNEDFTPTGNERVFIAKSVRWALAHLAFKIGGKISDTGRFLVARDGKRWFGRFK